MLNLTRIFQSIGQSFVRELQLNIRNQNDIRGRRFYPIKPSTAKVRQSVLGANPSRVSIGNKGLKKGIVPTTGKQRKSLATSVPITRLLFTQHFWRGAFKFKAEKDNVAISVSNDTYPDVRQRDGSSQHVSYADIVRFNNDGSSEVNRSITSPPLIFPNNDGEVVLMKAYKEAEERFNEAMRSGELEEMILEQGLQNLKIELNL